MKKILMIFLLLLPITTYGQTINVNDKPYTIVSEIINNTSFTQLTSLANVLDLDVVWEQSDKSVSISDNTKSIKLYVNQNKMLVDNTMVEISNNPIILNGKTYLPFRIIAENFGYKVDYINGMITLKKQSNKESQDYIKQTLDMYEFVINKDIKLFTKEEIKEIRLKCKKISQNMYDMTCNNDIKNKANLTISEIDYLLSIQDYTDAQIQDAKNKVSEYADSLIEVYQKSQ